MNTDLDTRRGFFTALIVGALFSIVFWGAIIAGVAVAAKWVLS